ncbi:reverse transcriptase domain-containing protein [Tanacetum coccineum]
MVPAMTSLTGFNGETIWPLGQLRLLITIGDADHFTKAWMNFMIVRSLSPYNGIIGRPGIREIQAVPSTAHRMLKFPVDEGIVTIRSVILIPTECATVITSFKEIPKEAGRDAIRERTDGTMFTPEEKLGYIRMAVVRHDRNTAINSGTSTQYPGRIFARSIEEKGPDPGACESHPSGDTDGRVGLNIEVYADDLVIKSHTEAEMLRDIEETFRTLRKINMELNPKKCTFEAMEGMFLGFMISPEGIKPCPDKTEASAEKSLPLFKTLKKCIKKSDFHWTPKAEQAFKKLKQHLSELPLLVAPKPKEELIVYLSATHGAISAVLMTERSTVQTPVYFVSRALQGPELNYTPMEKLVLSLVFAAKRLRRYFQAHPIAVITDHPIKQIISRPDVAGQLQKWSVILGEHNINYRPRTSVKGQILADFVVEKPNESSSDTSVVETPQEPCTLFMDGSSCVDGSGAGLILTSPEGTEFTYALRFQFTASNNEAEYEALIAGLRIAAQMGVRNVHVSVDSKLVANQVLGAYVAKEENMIKYLEKVKSLVIGFANFSISQVPRSKNKKADALSKIASTSFAHLSKQPLTPITAPLLFYKWGIDIAGPFLEGPGKVKFLIVAMDYFSKWIEAKAVATIIGSQVKKFVWDNIVCRFGLLGEIVSDNGKQFSDNPFKDWCDKLNITQRLALVKHPRSNGLVERANRSLGEGIKSRLGEGNKIDRNFPTYVAHRRMIKSSHGDTPFSLTYGTKAVIPVEIRMPTYRTAVVNAAHNDEELRLNLDLLRERRERATIREAKAKLKMTKYYNARVRGVTFRLGDFVYRSNDASHAVDGGKLCPKWEGPYEVTEALGDGAYRLRSMDGTVLLRTWNIANLNKCYI